MATAKKSQVKKPVKKATATAKKSTKKAAAKKPAVKAAVSPAAATTKATLNKKRVLSPLERLRSMHLISAIFYTIFAVFTAFFVSAAGTQVYLSFQARDTLANTPNVVLTPAAEVLANVQYRYVLMALLLLSALGSLLLATKLRARYEASVNYGVSGMRWILMGVTAAITLQFVSLLSGVQDLMTLKTVAGLIFVTTLLGWLAERENRGARDTKWLAYVASLVTGALAWLPLIGSWIGTSLYGEERFSWYVYALGAVTMAGFIGFALNQYAHLKKANLEYTYLEERYIRIDQLTKIAIVAIIFSALS